jgi:L-threonylcarbamoyladenylate synthase
VPTTRVIPVDPDNPDPAVIAEAAKILRAGRLVAFATETVYGLGADAINPKAVARIFKAKGRPSTNPLIVHVADKADALACVSGWPIRADRLTDRFWPGPLTLVLPRSLIIPALVTAGEKTVGVRVPRPNVARALIRAVGRPIAAPSANRSTGISPTVARHVLKDLKGKVDLILDSGQTTLGLESTVLDLSTDRPQILRPGGVTREQIAEVLGEPVDEPTPRSNPIEPFKSPGQMEVHYSPRTPTFRAQRHNYTAFGGPLGGTRHWALITFGEEAEIEPYSDVANGPTIHVRLVDPVEAARSLYAVLHNCDDHELELILIVPPPDGPEWQAVRDRVNRAALQIL